MGRTGLSSAGHPFAATGGKMVLQTLHGLKQQKDLYKLSQEDITPYCPEQNGMIERWFRSLKEECVWLHRFGNIDEAFGAIAKWINRYHTQRTHSALGYRT
jgi:putative transposase